MRSRLPALLVVAALGSCSSGFTGVVLPELEVVVGGGDGQFGTVGQMLPSPLRVVVRGLASQKPREGVTVLWSIESGSASLIGDPLVVTDSTGVAEVEVRLGLTTGQVVVTGSVQEQPMARVSLTVHTVGEPELTALSSPTATAGGTLVLTGSNFSSLAAQNVVLFSGVRGNVLSASGGQLTVEVPQCLPTRSVDVSVQLGTVASASLPIDVTAAGPPSLMGLGEVVDVVDAAGLECLRLAGGAGVQYLMTVASVGSVGATAHPYDLTGLVSGGAPSSNPRRVGSVAAPDEPARLQPSWPTDGSVAERWEAHLREIERGLAVTGDRMPARAVHSTPASVGAPGAVPAVGETRTFKVYQGLDGFDDVTAVARFVGARAAIFVDETSPEGGFSDQELEDLAGRFDEVIEPTVTATFGRPSDLDANDRIIILLTPAVNRLTPRGAQGMVGGFFFGLDLQPEKANSNGGEVFYTLVPDPSGTFSDARSVEDILSVVPYVLAHEFQHMVHYNERMLTLRAPNTEALWLSEGLAQMAEEEVARTYDGLGDAASAAVFRGGNRARAGLYLDRTVGSSVLVTAGQGTLAERGAGFLYLLYLEARFGGDFLGRLTRSTRTSIANVEAEVTGGVLWGDLLSDWWFAVYLDGSVPEPGPFSFPGVDLRAYFGSPFPLKTRDVGNLDIRHAGSLWSSSARYYIVTPPPGGSMSVRLGGEAGGEISAEAGLRVRILRIS